MKYIKMEENKLQTNKNIDEKSIKKTATAIVKYYNKHKLKRILLIGCNNELSSDYILSVIASILLKNGIEIHNVGLCTTSCLSYITQKDNYPLGVMITPSLGENNFTFINNTKLNCSFNQEFENLNQHSLRSKNNTFSKLKNFDNLKQDYVLFLKPFIKFNNQYLFNCIDNGTREIYKTLFKNQEIRNLDLEMFTAICIKKQKIGFYANYNDELYVILENGEICNGHQILKNLLHKSNNKPVDKHIEKKLLNSKDSIFAAIILANIIQLTKKPLKELIKDLKL